MRPLQLGGAAGDEGAVLRMLPVPCWHRSCCCQRLHLTPLPDPLPHPACPTLPARSHYSLALGAGDMYFVRTDPAQR